MDRTRTATLCTVARTASLLAVLALASATAASAYIVVLKNGNQIVAREKPQIRDGKAYFTTQSGTETFLAAADVDLAKTEAVNKDNPDRNARVIETKDAEPEPVEVAQKPTLRDLARQRSSLAPPVSAKPDAGTAMDPAKLPHTPAGNVDLVQLPRNDYRNGDLKGELLRYLRGQGIDQVSVFQGTKPERVLVEMTTNTEASVFKGIKDAAGALLQVRELYPGKVAALEVLMSTDARVRAGQFLFTPELASDVASGNLTPEAFFLHNVEF